MPNLFMGGTKVHCLYNDFLWFDKVYGLPKKQYSEEHLKKVAKFVAKHGVREPLIVAHGFDRNGKKGIHENFVAKGMDLLEAIRMLGGYSAPAVYQHFESEESLNEFLEAQNA